MVNLQSFDLPELARQRRPLNGPNELRVEVGALLEPGQHDAPEWQGHLNLNGCVLSAARLIGSTDKATGGPSFET